MFRSRAFGIIIILAITILLPGQSASAKDQVIIFQDVAYSFEPTLAPPSLGWRQTTLPLNGNVLGVEKPGLEPRIVWLRFSFDRGELGAGPFAISIDATSQVFETFVGNQLVSSNLSIYGNEYLRSYQPYLIYFSGSALSPNSNTISLRIHTSTGMIQTLDGIRIGQDIAVKQHFDRQYFSQYLGPQLVSAALMALTLLVSILWFTRRREKALAGLAVLGILWIANNLQHQLLSSFGAPVFFQYVMIAFPFFIMFSFVGFATSFFQNSIEKSLKLTAVFTILMAALARYLWFVVPFSNVVVICFAVPAAVAISCLFLKEAMRTERSESIAVLAAVICAFLFILHDLGREIALWHGAGFELMPYASILVFCTFGFAIGKRVLASLAAKEDLTAQLGQRIETTKANLLISEKARRELEVSSAITQERERMMREIHDGIGSSLVAALASAERQGRQSSTAVVALKSALTDLRIAVDSLEPVEGNVTTLLASLRYRIEPELKKANMAFEWKVDEVPELDWIDAPNALHVLRIFQEAFGNILGHAKANRIRVACKMQLSEGRPGIIIEVADNGRGFDPTVRPGGRGRQNMRDRAEALGGKLSIEGAPNAGCSVTLWLPLIRPKLV